MWLYDIRHPCLPGAPGGIGDWEAIQSLDVKDIEVTDTGLKPPIKGSRKQHRLD